MILRNVILAVFGLLLILTIFAAIHDAAAIGPACVLTILVLAIALENRRYRSKLGSSAEFRPTAERFIDPESGRAMQVWIGPGGERRYVEEEGRGATN